MKTKPQKIQIVAIIWIVDGVLSIAWGMGIIVAAITSLIGIICLPVSIYPFVLGIMEVVYGTKLLNDPVRLEQIPYSVSIMEIVDIVFGDFLGLAAGITTWILLSDDEVKAYFQQSRTHHSLISD